MRQNLPQENNHRPQASIRDVKHDILVENYDLWDQGGREACVMGNQTDTILYVFQSISHGTHWNLL
jgi:hypothetical protein